MHREPGVAEGRGAAIRHSGHDGACREQLRIRGKHRRRHASPRRKAGDEDPRPIEVKLPVGENLRDHRRDRGRFARAAAVVVLGKEREAPVGIVARRLLGQEQREFAAAGEIGPSALVVEALRVLRAAMQRHHQRHAGRQVVGNVAIHEERAGVWPEFGNELGLCGKTRPRHGEKR